MKKIIASLLIFTLLFSGIALASNDLFEKATIKTPFEKLKYYLKSALTTQKMLEGGYCDDFASYSAEITNKDRTSLPCPTTSVDGSSKVTACVFNLNQVSDVGWFFVLSQEKKPGETFTAYLETTKKYNLARFECKEASSACLQCTDWRINSCDASSSTTTLTRSCPTTCTVVDSRCLSGSTPQKCIAPYYDEDCSKITAPPIEGTCSIQGKKRCYAGKVQTCTLANNRLDWKDTKTCAADETCKESATDAICEKKVTAGTCTEMDYGKLRCSGAKIEKCSSQNNILNWVVVEDCSKRSDTKRYICGQSLSGFDCIEASSRTGPADVQIVDVSFDVGKRQPGDDLPITITLENMGGTVSLANVESIEAGIYKKGSLSWLMAAVPGAVINKPNCDVLANRELYTNVAAASVLTMIQPGGQITIMLTPKIPAGSKFDVIVGLYQKCDERHQNSLGTTTDSPGGLIDKRSL